MPHPEVPRKARPRRTHDILPALRHSCPASMRNPSRWLFVEPEVFEAPAVVDAVGHDGQVPDLRIPAGRASGVKYDRPGAVLDQALLELPHQSFALLDIWLGRLLVDELVDFRIAVTGIVTVGAADIVFVELLVGIVERALGDVETDREVLAHHLGIPLTVSTGSSVAFIWISLSCEI